MEQAQRGQCSKPLPTAHSCNRFATNEDDALAIAVSFGGMLVALVLQRSCCVLQLPLYACMSVPYVHAVVFRSQSASITSVRNSC